MVPTDYKIVPAVRPAAAVAGASVVADVIDCLGHRHLDVVLVFGAVGADPTAVKLQESEAADMAGATDVPGSVSGTDPTEAGEPSVLTAAALANKAMKFEVDLRFRKRFVRAVVTAGAGATSVAGFAKLGRAEILPTTAAQKGCVQVLMCPRK